MTKDQWVAKRQENSPVAWEEILASGYDVLPCSCQFVGCEGWKLLKVERTAVPVPKKTRVVHQTSPDAA